MRPQQREALTLLGYFFLRHGRGDRAFVIFRGLAELFPEDPDIHKGLAAAALEVGEDEVALAAIDVFAVVADAAASNPVRLIRAKALWRLGRAAEARAELAAYLTERRLTARRLEVRQVP